MSVDKVDPYDLQPLFVILARICASISWRPVNPAR
jgi:hypothetical protein